MQTKAAKMSFREQIEKRVLWLMEQPAVPWYNTISFSATLIAEQRHFTGAYFNPRAKGSHQKDIDRLNQKIYKQKSYIITTIENFCKTTPTGIRPRQANLFAINSYDAITILGEAMNATAQLSKASARSLQKHGIFSGFCEKEHSAECDKKKC
jgi:hypothetical protein